MSASPSPTDRFLQLKRELLAETERLNTDVQAKQLFLDQLESRFKTHSVSFEDRKEFLAKLKAELDRSQAIHRIQMRILELIREEP